MLTLWDTFVERECTAIVQNLPTKLVIWAINLKASSFNGITLSTKANSNIFINAELLAVTDYKEWVLTNKEKLDQLIERKPFVPISPPKLSPPADNKYTSIALLLGLYLGRKFYWIKAHWKIITMQQRFWYMSCSNCKKTSTADLGQIHKCRFCKYEHAKAEPRANAFVRFEDKTGQLDASIIGKATEALLETNANVIMEHYQQNPNTVLNNLTQTSSEIELLFYLKAIQKKKDPPEYRYEIIFIFNPITSSADVESSSAMIEVNPSTIGSDVKDSTQMNTSLDTKAKHKVHNTNAELSTNMKEITVPSAKRPLFQKPDENIQMESKAKKENTKAYESDDHTNIIALKKTHE
ncbi:replication protein A 70 kDa DNA-binding subunit D-like isoform X1 [Olea europaea var. sylvestris]|uniref:replication protein A 70 kDa DNA-binding subunit D-like isoform X1 n=1 Tax=Olea europaea var. sylvestris TaxID=158386 RepID=UPI000C1D3851|nr:replication protein A 70 kDa DNA-binding subunit D-like isoform X1 [Olea europaea var. sylvestris]XP_022886255.1 replication protein A 70 kDa DNA-binding subunit D-like isoform X1 [Olea europaea var. sylvestris]XP_022886256.1 replication protein A 70 kDa DNA-binding subunit D-like isoform X1 [Olea europaea var. sylvestris]XP_022886258.1 replication protein A 70 kDa DNA-binding subunit D-like isoform X1 [Olea europaea var. sylvestris]XP_022886259.1 replication protein A 70 kDa DNA-binding sub